MVEMILGIFALGASDRVRGSGWFWNSHFLGMIGMGAATGLLLGLHGVTLVYVIAAVAIGAAPGWGNPLGAAFDNRPMGTNYEWWQRGITRTNAFLALTTRGAMWGVLLIPVSPGAACAYLISFVVAPYLARTLFPRNSIVDTWGIMEFCRGVLTGLLIALFT